jgi:hypothetical protein
VAVRWRDAVLTALRSFSTRHRTRAVERQPFLAEELAGIVNVTESTGLTPDQTLSRHLQELRDDGLVQFLGNGSYLLLDSAFDVESEDLTDEALDHAIRAGRLLLGRVETEVRTATARRRRGQERIRARSLEAYDGRCAVCDVGERAILVASHILRWADAPEQRGELTNVLCLCRFHDVLFEQGHWSLTDDLQLVKRPQPRSGTVAVILEAAHVFRSPRAFPPNPEYLRHHRRRCGLGE